MRLEKRAGDAKTNRFGLASEATADGLPRSTSYLASPPMRTSGCFEVGHESRIRHILADFDTIDGDDAFTSLEVDAGDRGLTTTGAIVFETCSAMVVLLIS
jgi:hypothetical protein